ncbi:MAG: AtpZ/AtpI family protein [Acidobacteria bacterium]|nr:AtpZ/AtpI family protein [Acidobacteriota bacterium]
MAPPRKKSFARMVGEYSSLAAILPASIVVGYAIGYGLDKLFGTHFWYIVWLLIGIAAGMRDLIRKTMVDFQKDIDNSDGGE